MSDRPRSNDPVAKLELVGLACAAAAGTALVIWVLRICPFGFDFTDEGFDLQWIAHPYDYSVSITEFGFFYHPLFRLLRGDIVLLRQLNIIITLGLGWVLSYLVLGEFGARDCPPRCRLTLRSICLSFAFSIGTLAFLDPWLPTPNYDSLALQALFLAASGMLLVERVYSRLRTLGWLVLGVSGCFAFLAKPTTAAALAVVVGLYLIATRKANLRMIILSVAVAFALLAISAWLIDGSIGSFVSRILTGAKDASSLQARHTLREALRFDNFSLGARQEELLWGKAFIVFVISVAAVSDNRLARLCSSIVVILISLACILTTLNPTWLRIDATPFQGLQLLAVPFGSILAAFACSWGQMKGLPGFKSVIYAICLSMLPIVYAFGTSVNYWLSAAHASIFWVLAGLAVLASARPRGISWRALLPIAVATELLTVVLIVLSTEHPYREINPLRENRDQMRFRGSSTTLWVSHDFATYVSRLDDLARSSGFKSGDSIIDLTGHYPGALYAIGAISLGRPWMIGGYAGSEDLTAATLDRVPRETIVKSWILTEMSGPRSISTNIMKRYGLDLDKDYTEVGSLLSPPGDFPNSYTQRLLKPAH